MRVRRIAATLVASAMLGFGLTSAAVAEDSFKSYFENIALNKETRRWTDNYKDGNSTTITLSHCINSSAGGTTADPRFDLRRHRSLMPDVTYGEKQAGNCRNTTTTKSWGKMTTKGDYFFRYRGINGTTQRLSASTVKVAW